MQNCYALMPPLIEVMEYNSSFAEVLPRSHKAVIILVIDNGVLQEISRDNQCGD